MTETLPPQPWMTSQPVRAVMDALSAAGGPDCARFVGGCVRNALMRRKVDDVDIATTLEAAGMTCELHENRRGPATLDIVTYEL